LTVQQIISRATGRTSPADIQAIEDTIRVAEPDLEHLDEHTLAQVAHCALDICLIVGDVQ
jgi:archaellum component FlaC